MNSFQGKTLLVNGAGRGHLNLIKTAKSMGIRVVTTGMAGPCLAIADKNYPEVHPGHPDEVLEVAKKEHVDGVTICCNDNGIQSVGRCNDVLHLTGISEQAAKYSSDKLAMKKQLVKCGVRTAKFEEIHNLEELQDAMTRLVMPVIIKASDLQGSRGICIVKDITQLNTSFLEVMSLTHKDYCIVEEFIEGVEFGAQAFIYNGEILFVLPHGDETVMCKTAVPVGHYMPYQINAKLAADVDTQVRNAIRALGLDNCAVNIDFISKRDKAYIIELTGRGGANGLTDIVGKYFGIDYYEMIVVVALGGDPRDVYANRLKNPRSTISKMITSQKSGIVKSVLVPPLPNTDIIMFIEKGSEVRAFTNSNDDIGQIVVSGKDLSDCQDKIFEAKQLLTIEFE